MEQPINMPATIKLREHGSGGYDLSITGCTLYKSGECPRHRPAEWWVFPTGDA